MSSSKTASDTTPSTSPHSIVSQQEYHKDANNNRHRPESYKTLLRLRAFYNSGPEKMAYVPLAIKLIVRGILVILQDLSNKNPQFRFLKTACVAFCSQDLDRFKLAPHIPQRPQSASSSAAETERSIDNEIMKVGYINMILCELLDSTIYELLEVSRRNAIFDEIPPFRSMMHRLGIVLQLRKKLGYNSSPHSSPPQSFEASLLSGVGHGCHKYPCPPIYESNELIRVLQIHAGVGESNMQLSLKDRNLHRDGLEMALSYVWGDDLAEETIMVNGIDFRVRKNLHGILHSLRRPDTDLFIWIDAICINQTDKLEKTHQVRMMGDIYSKARTVLIWLMGPTTSKLIEHQVPNSDISTIDSPLPLGFGGTTMDQYDLSSILQEYTKYPPQTPWDGKQVALCLMLRRCMKEVMSCQWWSRVWTVQEAVLPPSPPTFAFRGHQFSYEELATALGMREDETVEDLLFNEDADTKSIVSIFKAQYGHLSFGLPSILDLRSETARKNGPKILAGCLEATAAYNASVPQDKIFALQSLLPGCLGQLIKVDYTETYEKVMKRVTARCYNSIARLFPMVRFNFLMESRLGADERSLFSSWVLDFSFSDAEMTKAKLAFSLSDDVTVAGMIAEDATSKSVFSGFDAEIGRPYPIYATPTTLFCTGVCMDRVYRTDIIPNLSNGTSTTVANLVGFTLPLIGESVVRYTLTQNSRPGTRKPFDWSEKWWSLANFFIQFKYSDPIIMRDLPASFNDLVESRVRNIVGKHAFVTTTGLIGIATAPIQADDWLCILHTATVFLILREVGDQSDHRHKIIAKAAVYDEVDDLKALFESLPTRNFQII
ncbi:heterokaryon incompatibility protein-domain-containing protein [Xylaria curta]|nr:heterokaryon incompatibility protein-domain-containing protein [Xylaria curta]